MTPRERGPAGRRAGQRAAAEGGEESEPPGTAGRRLGGGWQEPFSPLPVQPLAWACLPVRHARGDGRRGVRRVCARKRKAIHFQTALVPAPLAACPFLPFVDLPVLLWPASRPAFISPLAPCIREMQVPGDPPVRGALPHRDFCQGLTMVARREPEICVSRWHEW
jgi:hypothetical protein